MSRSAGVARALVLFLSAIWCGLLAAFGAGAGIVLSASPSRHAGGIVNKELLDALDVASYALAALLFALVLLASRDWPRVRRGLAVRLLFVGAAAALASHLVVTPEMVAIRDHLPGPIDTVPRSDPRRVDWGRLHGLSAMTLLVRIAASTGLFVVVFGATLPTER